MAATTEAEAEAKTTDKPGEATASWHRWVSDHPVGGIVLVGIIATQLGTYFGYVFEAVGIPKLPWPIYNGILALGFNGDSHTGAFGAAANEEGQIVFDSGLFFVGQSLHYVNGIVFAILFAVLARHMMPFRNDHWGSVLKGLLYGVVMTIISVGLLVPYAYVPGQGYGLFLFDGPDGWKLPLAVLIWHLIYGFFLGLLYQPEREAPATSEV